MSKVAKTLARVLRGNADTNIRFDDLRALLISLGFTERIRGDHHILTHEDVAEILNLQPRGAQAKAYQVKQVRSVLTSHSLVDEPVTEKSSRKEKLDKQTGRKALEEEDGK